MTKGLIGGMTDYSHQSFDDIITDLKSESENVIAFIEMIEDNLKIVQANKFWDTVPNNFKGTVHYSLKHYHTTDGELLSIIEEIQKEVAEHHCKRLERIAQVAHEINIKIGQDWHGDYENRRKERNKVFTSSCRINVGYVG
jgi:translation initiation factor RLI1